MSPRPASPRPGVGLAARRRRDLGVRPRTPDELHQWLRTTLDIDAARTPLIPGHASPFDYLRHAFFEAPRREACATIRPAPARDCVVWACRGGGKTFYAAVATLLDMVFKPGVEVCALGGSLEQSERLYAHLRRLFETGPLGSLLAAKPTRRRLALVCGSVCEISAASETSVRGRRPTKIRCDEVELFDTDIWRAALLTPRSKRCGEIWAHAAVEALSTMHRPYGLMRELVADATPFAHSSRACDAALGSAGLVPRTCAAGPCSGDFVPRTCEAGPCSHDRCAPNDSGASPRTCCAGPCHEEGPCGNSGACLRHPVPRTCEAGPCSGEFVPRTCGAGPCARDRCASNDSSASPRTCCAGPCHEEGPCHEGVASRVLFRWGVIDVLGACEGSRPCAPCPLLPECARRAKREPGASVGHIEIDDAIAMKRRVGSAQWESEMLCLRPARDNLVLPEFGRDSHVFGHATDGPPAPAPEGSPRDTLLCGMDFGFRAPTVILWAHLDPEGTLRILDERVVSEARLESHAAALLGDAGAKPEGAPDALADPPEGPLVPLGGPAMRWPKPAWVGVDPAGHQRNEQTGLSSVAALRKTGLRVRAKRAPGGIEEGLRLVRARLRPATGAPRLFVHARCAKLIEALETYHYPEDPSKVAPAKDGPDHAVDALRYLIVSLDLKDDVRVENYL